MAYFIKEIVVKKIVVLFMLILGCFAFSSNTSISAQTGTNTQNATMPSMESCEAVCRKCQKVCEKTLAYCRKKGGKHAENKHLDTLRDCIAACKMSAEFLSRNSANHAKSCGFCADICKLCAESCESFGDDKQMKDCAAECRKCVESCEKMSNMK